MGKIKLDNSTRVFPMPMVVVGAVVEGKNNYLAVARVCWVNPSPSDDGGCFRERHHTNKGIREHKEFSVSIPAVDLIREVGCIGLFSCAKTDKSKIFESIRGQLKYAPMIRHCPVSLECKVVTKVDLPSNEFFIGEIMGIYTEERYLTDGKPDIDKIKPFILTMPDSRYRDLGKIIGSAWSIGKGS